MPFPQVEAELARACAVLDSLGIAVPFDVEGGQETTGGWRSVGRYATDAAGNRWVLEALVLGREATCVARVYGESTQQIGFATKSARAERLGPMLDAAVRVFADGMPADALQASVLLAEIDELAALTGSSPWHAPIPPPVRLADLEDFS